MKGHFSLKTTLTCVVIAALMFKAAGWQWSRYLEKQKLVESYQQHNENPSAKLDANVDDKILLSHLYDKVSLKGRYDYSKQTIVINRKHKSGPGHWLMTPFKIDGSDLHVMVSRGFIPFEDRDPATWEKYRFEAEEELIAVVQKTSPQTSVFVPSNPNLATKEKWQSRWKFPDIEQMASQLPYPLIQSVFLQRIGKAPSGDFPAEAISIRVPPSTHFGYTIEWTILGLLTLAVGTALQIFRKHPKIPADRGELDHGAP